MTSGPQRFPRARQLSFHPSRSLCKCFCAAIVVLTWTLSASIPAEAAIPTAERNALVALYNSTDGPNWIDNTNWMGGPGTECTWYGVFCDQTPSVMALSLASNQLSGVIPPAIGSLSALQSLNLSGNELTGSIPREIGSLTALVLLNVSSNQLSGSIPPEIGNLSALETMSLSENSLSGSIPSEIGNLGALRDLYLTRNSLSGSIPPEIGQLVALRYLFAAHNGFTGSIPHEIGNMSALEIMNLSRNDLSGSIPSEIGNLGALWTLDLRMNSLSGSIPKEIGNLINIFSMSLAVNQLSGSIPPEIGNLHKLRELHLATNQLSGSIPPQVGNMSSLQSIELGGNRLTGSIPSEIAILGSLAYLNLRSNELSGPIPPELGLTKSLAGIDLHGNRLTGNIPPELANLNELRYLDLSSNQLTGPIPRELGNRLAMKKLRLAFNSLTGEIPPELAGLVPTPGELTLDHNGLSASDPIAKSWADAHDPGWESTQTVAPSGLAVEGTTEHSVTLSWNPILYTDGRGGYEIYVANHALGPYRLAATTPNKSGGSGSVSGLATHTTYYFKIRTFTHYYMRINSSFTVPVSATTTGEEQPVAQLVILGYPSGMVQTSGSTGATDQFVIANLGNVASEVTIGRSGDFFTQNPVAFTLEAGKTQRIVISAGSKPAGFYEGASLVTGTNADAQLRVPAILLVSDQTAGQPRVEMNLLRIDVQDLPGIDDVGSVELTNVGTGTAHGILVTDTPWLLPDNGTLEIQPNQSIRVSFAIQDQLLPRSGLEIDTFQGSLRFVYLSGGHSSSGLSASTSGTMQTQTVVTTSSLATVTEASLPSLSGELSLVAPGLVNLAGFTSVLSLTNRSVVPLKAIQMFRLGEGELASTASYLTVSSIPSRTGVTLANPLAAFDLFTRVGSLHLRGSALAEAAAAAWVLKVDDPRGTVGYALPVVGTNTGAGAGDTIVLTGLGGADGARLDLLLQELSGKTVTVQIELVSADGTVLTTRTEDLSPFELIELKDQGTSGVAAARIMPDTGSEGSIHAVALVSDESSGNSIVVADSGSLYGAGTGSASVIPRVWHGSMGNRKYHTEMSITNRGKTSATAEIRYFGSVNGERRRAVRRPTTGGSSVWLTSVSRNETLALQPGQTVTFNVSELFGAPEGSSGWAEVVPASGELTVAARLISSDPDSAGTVGTAVPVVPKGTGMKTGDRRYFASISDAGADSVQRRLPGTFRSSLGLVETSGSPVTVQVTIPSLSGTSLASVRIVHAFSLAASEALIVEEIGRDLMGILRGHLSDIHDLHLELEVTAGSGTVVPFVISFDNGSGDAIMRLE